MLWANATIEILDPAVFGVLAHTRPAALELVRGVVLHVACFGDCFDTEVGAVRDVCDYFNRLAATDDVAGGGKKLRFFTVVLSMDKLPPAGTTTSEEPDDGGGALHNSAAAAARIEELATMFRGLDLEDGASFHIRFGRGLPLKFPSRSDPDQGARDLQAVLKHISGNVREAWMPTCIRAKEEETLGRVELSIRGLE
jgi:hypothetical protein